MKKKYLALGIGLLLAALVLVLLFFGVFRDDTKAAVDTEGIVELEEEDTEEDTSAEEDEEEESAQSEEELSEEEAEEAEDPYESPIDFAALQAQNADIYAWLDIPGTDISYPVLQNAEDDTYYLDHGEDGSASSAGALFTEHVYNSTDFSDPVTIIYGHHMRSGVYFGNLQAIYSDSDSFYENSEAVIYLPDAELHYTVFAAVPYSNLHILYYYDFTIERRYNAFLSSIYDIRSIGANFNDEIEVTSEDSILILSTCLKGDNTQRYLVLMRLDEETD